MHHGHGHGRHAGDRHGTVSERCKEKQDAGERFHGVKMMLDLDESKTGLWPVTSR
jgi:hypothetical protein